MSKILKKTVIVGAVGAFIASGVTGVVLKEAESYTSTVFSSKSSEFEKKTSPITTGDTEVYEYGTLQYFYGYDENYSVIQFSDIKDDVYYVDNWFCISFVNAEIDPMDLYFNEINMYYEIDDTNHSIDDTNFLFTDESGTPLVVDNHYYHIKPNKKYIMYFNLSSNLLPDTKFYLNEQYDNVLAGVNYSLCSFGAKPLGINLDIPDTIFNFNMTNAQYFCLRQKYSGLVLRVNDNINGFTYYMWISSDKEQFSFEKHLISDGSLISFIRIEGAVSYSFDYPVILDTNLIPDLIQTTSDYTSGYDVGYDVGKSDGYIQGSSDGFIDGKAEGTSEGYAEGINSTVSGPLEIINQVFTGIGGFMGIELFPGIYVGTLIGIPLFTTAFFIIFKILKGQ